MLDLSTVSELIDYHIPLCVPRLSQAVLIAYYLCRYSLHIKKQKCQHAALYLGRSFNDFAKH